MFCTRLLLVKPFDQLLNKVYINSFINNALFIINKYFIN